MLPTFLLPYAGYLLGAILCISSGIAVGYRYASSEFLEYKLKQQETAAAIQADLQTTTRKLVAAQSQHTVDIRKLHEKHKSTITQSLSGYQPSVDCKLPMGTVRLLRDAAKQANSGNPTDVSTAGGASTRAE